MATPFRLKRSSVASKRPGLTDLQKGELALNFYDGHLFAERDTAGVGIGTTIANLTPWKETFGGAAINYENSVGIGSTNPTGRLDVNGLTVLDEVKISGVSTFASNVDIDADLDVDGHTELDHVNVSAASTFGGLIDINAGAQADTLKVEDLTEDRIVIAGTGGELEDDGNLTFNGSTLSVGVNLDVDGLTDLDELKVAGVSTFSGQVGFTTHVDINDHSRLRIGDGDDLQIWHQGSNSIIQNSTGELQLRGDNIRLLNAATTKDYAFFNNDGSVDLYYDDSIKFQTTGIGVSILSGAGLTATIAGPPNLIIDPGVVGDNTGNVRIKGDLYVDGTNFIVDSETITLADHVVGIASTSTTDALADGAGIGIGTNKFFTFDNTNTAFKSTENLNLETGHTYKIDGTDVLSSTTVGSAVTNSSLTEVGTLSRLNVSGVTTSTGGFRAGAGGTTFTTKGGNVGINTDDANSDFMLEVYGDINIVGTDVDFYENGKRRTAGVGVYSGGTSIAGLGATILDFVGTAVSTVVFDASAGIATINLRKTTFSRDTTSFTATSGQTTYSLSYTPGFIDVYVNGVRLTASEYTATNGTSVVLATGAFTGDIVDITAFVDDGFAPTGKWSPEDGTPANIFYTTGNVGIASANPRVTLDVLGEARISGVVTAGAYLVGTNQVISSARELQNIASLDATTTATIESAVANAPNTFTDIDVTGIATFNSTVNVEDLSLNRVVFVGAGSSLTDDTNFTFDGSTLVVGVGATVGGALTVTGNVDFDADLDVDGVTNLDITLISETLDVTGVSTFRAAVDIDADLDVDGHTELDDVNVSAASTFGGAVDINGGATADTLIVEDLTDNRIVISGAGGELEDDANFTFDGSTLVVGVGATVGGALTVAGGIDVNTIRGATNNSNVAFGARASNGAHVISLTLKPDRTATFDGGVGIADSIFHIGDDNTQLRFPAADTFTVETDGTERLRITSGGKIGIGTDNPEGDVDIGEQFSIKTTTTAVSSTAATTVDSLPIATYRSSRFQVQITQGTDYQSADLMVIHDGTTATLIEYGSIATANMLATFTSTISGSNLILQVNMGSSSSATVKVVRYGISI